MQTGEVKNSPLFANWNEKGLGQFGKGWKVLLGRSEKTGEPTLPLNTENQRL